MAPSFPTETAAFDLSPSWTGNRSSKRQRGDGDMVPVRHVWGHRV